MASSRLHTPKHTHDVERLSSRLSHKVLSEAYGIAFGSIFYRRVMVFLLQLRTCLLFQHDFSKEAHSYFPMVLERPLTRLTSLDTNEDTTRPPRQTISGDTLLPLQRSQTWHAKAGQQTETKPLYFTPCFALAFTSSVPYDIRRIVSHSYYANEHFHHSNYCLEWLSNRT